MALIFHPSASPETRRQAIMDDLSSDRLPPAFLYEGNAQSERWLSVHEAFSPFRNDFNCVALYDWIAIETATYLDSHNVHVVGLGCGSGIKDATLLKRLKGPTYWPIDISENLTREATINSPISKNYPMVLDLACAKDIDFFFEKHLPIDAQRVFTLFGILPNFDPEILAKQLQQFLKSGDILLLSANLAPGDDYYTDVQRIIPQYDNDITRNWLIGALGKIGVSPEGGTLTFGQEEMHCGLRRIVAWWHFDQPHQMEYSGVNFNFRRGSKLEVFYSIRHTIPKVVKWLELIGLSSIKHRSCDSDEEVIFLCLVP